jgi:hypothetical protein
VLKLDGERECETARAAFGFLRIVPAHEVATVASTG